MLNAKRPAFVLFALTVFFFHNNLLAEQIPIVNPSFENDLLCEGCFITSTSDWITSFGGGDGTLNPTFTQYPGGVPNGNNVAYANLMGNHVHQVLSSNLEANMHYTLVVEIGRRTDTGYVGYRVQLRAGGVVLAEDNSSQTPAAGAFVTATVIYESSPLDAELGQPLEIWLLSLGSQTNYDDVRLEILALIFADGFESGNTAWWSSVEPPLQCPWTSWLDRDNPSGVGDFETLADFLAAGQACPSPVAIECETLTGEDWQEAGEVYVCNTQQGGYCYNAQQPDGQCLDYRVRFRCCEP